MIDTNVEFCKHDLEEMMLMFEGGNALFVKHQFSENGNKVVNTITVNGQTFAYGNLIGSVKNDIERKRLVKRYAKLSLYKVLSKVLERELPWGALTGIRPTKLAYQKIEEGEDFRDFFQNTMKVSPNKTLLTERVISSQKGIYEKNSDNTDFFVFIPFCPSRCEYCSFITADINVSKNYVDEYSEKLIDEIKYSKKYVKKLRSIYIGGGTPVSIPDYNLEKILSAIDEINCGVEYTVEAGRPDAITKEKLNILKSHNVTRICVNPQTFSDKTLKFIGRKHTALDVVEKYNLAKDMFSVNMDLIAGLPKESVDDFKYSLDKTIELSPDGITVHTLSIKRGSALSLNGNFVNSLGVEEMIDYAHDRLFNRGYIPYYIYRQKYMAGNLENTGYCKPNKQCVYNIDVMEEISNNVACGAGAISKAVNFNADTIERYANPKDVLTYIEKEEEIKREKDALFLLK